MSRALSYMFALAEAKRRDTAKEQLGPSQDGHGLADDGVERTNELPDESIDPLLPVTLEV
jgi:hypothetical protein